MNMSYAVKERLNRAYQNVIDFYKNMMYRIKPEELLIFREGGDFGGDAVYIRRPGTAAECFVIFPPSQPI